MGIGAQLFLAVLEFGLLDLDNRVRHRWAIRVEDDDVSALEVSRPKVIGYSTASLLKGYAKCSVRRKIQSCRTASSDFARISLFQPGSENRAGHFLDQQRFKIGELLHIKGLEAVL